jgi:NADH:ubiquinone oxidoreductase subunit 2 (subunit N)
MLLTSILTIITFRTLPGLNKILNEIILTNYGTKKIETKMNYIIYTRITAVILLLTALISGQVLGFPEIEEGFSIYNGLFQVTQVSLFIEIFIVIIGALILVAWPGLPVSETTTTNFNNYVTSLLSNHIAYTRGASETLNIKSTSEATVPGLIVGQLGLVDNKHTEQTERTELYLNTGVNLVNYYQNYLDKSKDYVMIILFNLFGALLLISSFDLISLYLSIELQSFALYILATFYKESRIVTAAGLKYFLLGALSSCFILLGSAFIYAFSGLTKFDSIYCLISTFDPSVNHTQFILGIILIFIGFLFKIGAAPLHNWAPDVYNDTPTIVTTWLTIMPKLSILILLLELYLQIDGFEGYFFSFNPFQDYIRDISSLPQIVSDFFQVWGGVENYEAYRLAHADIPNIPADQVWEEGRRTLLAINISNIKEIYSLSPFDRYWDYFFNWQIDLGGGSDAIHNLLFISSLLSLIIGTVLGLAQSQIKRLMAYSTISHLGFLLLALSINTEEALDSFLFYIIQYTITNLNIFLIIIAFNYLLCSLVKNNLVIKDIKYISELTNQYDKNPILTVSFIICLLSMAGIPPFIGFYSKLFVLFSAISISDYFIAIIAIIVSVISAYYYLRIIKVLYTEDNNKNTSIAPSQTSTDYAANNYSSQTEGILILTNLHSLVIAVLSLFLVLFFLNPVLILTSTRVLSLSLFNF